MKVDRQILRKNCNFICAGATLSHEMKVRSSKTEEKYQFYLCRSNPFARNEGPIVKYCGKIAILLVPEQPFRTKWGSSKTAEKLQFYLCRSNPFARKEGRSSKTNEKLRFCNPFARNEDRHKLRKNCNFTCAGATLSREMRFDAQKLSKIAILLVLDVEGFECKSVCV